MKRISDEIARLRAEAKAKANVVPPKRRPNRTRTQDEIAEPRNARRNRPYVYGCD